METAKIDIRALRKFSAFGGMVVGALTVIVGVWAVAASMSGDPTVPVEVGALAIASGALLACVGVAVHLTD